ncbi:zinc finger BED domain-containing protein RICESLEEPER 2-like [Senna tora]|uniref:Zinc finger BED domain-containing protein RICESLEEPER 2-like n=1 Tax=Senna tora TaxID=362788 RepID=A0A834WJK7_9FABA|nr:zinc finger BED domain-containing protein RICESLEEPER 2-like [Senna tora]
MGIFKAKQTILGNKKKQTKYKEMILKTQVSRREKKESLQQVEKKHSVAWDHFIKLVDDQVPDEHIVECKHCKKEDSKQQVLGFEPKKDGGGNNMIKAPQVYDVEECRKAIAIFVIADEHPFKVVEGEAAFKSHLREASSIEAKNEVEKYLAEAIVDADDKFDVLHWWKTNMSRFRVLSSIARDVLAVPVSTVASESAFSIDGRVLDTFRSSISLRMTEALICAQNWLRPTIINLDISEIEEMAQCEKIEMELGDGKQVGHSMDQQPMVVD